MFGRDRYVERVDKLDGANILQFVFEQARRVSITLGWIRLNQHMHMGIAMKKLNVNDVCYTAISLCTGLRLD